MRTIEIREEVEALAERLGLDYRRIGRIDIRPTTVEVHYFSHNEGGRKHVHAESDDPALIGQPVVVVLFFKVKT